MKLFEDMSFQDLLDYQELLKQDALWSDIRYAEFYWRRSACVAEEINRRMKEKRCDFGSYQQRESQYNPRLKTQACKSLS